MPFWPGGYGVQAYTGGKLSGGIHHKEGVEFTFHRAAR